MKRGMIIGLLLISIFLISGIGGCAPSGAPAGEGTPSNTSAPASASTDNDEELIDLAVEANNLSMCDKVVKTSRRNVCYNSIMYKLKDPSVCEGLMGADYCYNYFARTNKDAILCEKIVNADMKTSCIVYTGGIIEVSGCEQISDTYDKDKCYINLATTNKDITICDTKLIHDSSIGDCYYHVIYVATSVSCDVCTKLEDIENRNDCYTNCARRDKSTDACDKITEASQPGTSYTAEAEKWNCYTSIAQNTKDCSICAKITDSYHQNYCNMKCK